MNKIFEAINIINEDYCNRRGIDWKPVTNPLDPDYDSRPDEEREARVAEEVERLLDNPSELLELNLDKINDIYKAHHSDRFYCIDMINGYYFEVAEAQAEDTI
mgnify:CR=1 FL=1